MTPDSTAAAELRRVIDEAARGRVLVLRHAAVVPGAVEIVVGHEDSEVIAAALSAHGLVGRAGRFVRFGEDGALLVVVLDADAWGLPEPELDRLFRTAEPVPGTQRCAVPQLPDELLMLSRRIEELPDVVPAIQRIALHRAIAEGGNAWVPAAQRARHWRVSAALDAVKNAYDAGDALTPRQRRAAARERAEQLPPRRGTIIAFSGLDGAGKSTQAHALAALLPDLGFEVSVRWTRLALSPLLTAVAAPVKLLVTLLRRPQPPEGVQVRTYRGSTGADEDSLPTATDLVARGIRERFRIVNSLWTTVVALVNALEQRAALASDLAAGRVVICDRYVLDSVAHLRHRYGGADQVRLQERLLRRLVPRPAAAFLLDLPAEAAYRRKPEEFSVEDLAAQATEYRQAAADLGVRVLDATQSPGRLAQVVAAEVWSALS